MATISSHILDSIDGTHAGGIRVQLFKLIGEHDKELVFDVNADAGGRVSQNIVIDAGAVDVSYELIFHSDNYFTGKTNSPGEAGNNRMQVMRKIVVSVALPDPNERYHFPVMLSPHSYAIWWS